MLIRVHKGKHGRNTLVCQRDDGSSTIARLNLPPEHDLVHYAVETVLRRTGSFYALVAGGVDVADFARKAPDRGFDIPAEAVQTEHVVALLQLRRFGAAEADEFNATVARMCASTGLPPPPPIGPEDLDRIQEEIDRLLGAWHRLPEGQGLELPGPAAPA